MKDIYLTSTFSNSWNVGFNSKIGEALERAGCTCYLPHRDTDQSGTEKEIFTDDLAGIANSKCILAVALNETPNWGAELGYAFTLKKPIIALTTPDHVIPLICAGMITDVIRVQSLDDIETYVPQLIETIKRSVENA